MMKSFILNSSNVERAGFIWNMAGSMLMAFQSVIFLVILTRTVDLTTTGVFTIAYANANLFINIGKYGMRNYQVSDVKDEYNFQEYLKSRWITTGSMIIVSILYVWGTTYIKHYSFEKCQIIIWMCLLKVPDAIEDVYYGDYQKKGRLDIASKAMTIRALFTTILFAIVISLTRNLLLTLVISVCCSSIVLFIFLSWTYVEFKDMNIKRKGRVRALLMNCFPFFLSNFLAFYIGNAPKYAIDAQLSDELQAYYGFIAMPVFVIGLLNSFIFTPMLYPLSCAWNERKKNIFYKMLFIQIVIVIITTIVCVLGAYILGIPLLSFLYNTDLSDYRRELMILLFGGGLLGLAGVLNTIITIVRFQGALVIGYGIVSGIALLTSNYVVKGYGIMGASCLYTMLMTLLCICFGFIMIVGIKRKW